MDSRVRLTGCLETVHSENLLDSGTFYGVVLNGLLASVCGRSI